MKPGTALAVALCLVSSIALGQGKPRPGGGGGTVSGTVTANQGGGPWTDNITQIGGAAVSASAAMPCQVTDGSAYYVGAKTGQFPAALDGSGFLKTHEQGTAAVSAASLPLPSGAATAAKQPALGTAGTASSDVLSVQGIAAMTALKTDGSGVTQPVSATTLPLPAGASTSAKQPALGAAGTASTDVLSVQGIAGMTPLKTDGSGVTQPVSGTFWQATQPVSGTFWQATQPMSAVSLPLPTGASTAAKQPALGTAGAASADVITVQGVSSMTALKVDPSGVTSPVSAASLPLPAGAATAAKQPALGTAGTAAGDVISVQGIASMTALKVDGSGVTQPVSLSGNQAVNTAQINGVAPTMGNGASGTGVQRVTIASDSTGQVALATGANTIGALTANQSVNVAQMGGVATTMGNGVSGTGVQRVTVASDSTGQTAITGNVNVTQGGGWTVGGNAADGATQAGSPLYTGSTAVAPAAAPTTVTAGQAAGAISTTDRIPYVAPYHPNGFSAICDTVSAATQCIGLSGAGKSYYITSILISASAAINVTVTSSTTAGNACATSPAKVTGTLWFPANGGGVPTFPEPFRVPANSALCFTPSGASGTAVITGFIAP